MRIMFFGDVMGRAGRRALIAQLPALRRRLEADFVIVNGENAAGGFGITEKICRELLDAGADAVTLGNHSWDKAEALVFIERTPALLRPLNYPPGTPGRGAQLFTAGSRKILVMNVLGQLKMAPMDDPFRAVDRELAACPLGEGCDAIVIDIHAELTSEKMAMGKFTDGRASLVVGTHTHVPTADTRILPAGTGYQTDLGMCGDYDSIIGMDSREALQRFTHKIPTGRFEVAGGPATLCGILVEIDEASGLARRIAPIRTGGVLVPAMPEF